MATRVMIEVTVDDIVKGLPRRACDCPVARALKRKFPRMKNIGVDVGKIYVGRKSMTMPDSVRAFVGRFDDGGGVKPFSFELALR